MKKFSKIVHQLVVFVLGFSVTPELFNATGSTGARVYRTLL